MTKFWIGLVLLCLIVLGVLVGVYHEDIIRMWDNATEVVEEMPTGKLDPEETFDRWDGYLSSVDEDLSSKVDEATGKNKTK